MTRAVPAAESGELDFVVADDSHEIPCKVEDRTRSETPTHRPALTTTRHNMQRPSTVNLSAHGGAARGVQSSILHAPGTINEERQVNASLQMSTPGYDIRESSTQLNQEPHDMSLASIELELLKTEEERLDAKCKRLRLELALRSRATSALP